MNRLKPQNVIQILMTSCVGCGIQYIYVIYYNHDLYFKMIISFVAVTDCHVYFALL